MKRFLVIRFNNRGELEDGIKRLANELGIDVELPCEADREAGREAPERQAERLTNVSESPGEAGAHSQAENEEAPSTNSQNELGESNQMGGRSLTSGTEVNIVGGSGNQQACPEAGSGAKSLGSALGSTDLLPP